MPYFALFYEVVDDFVERSAPFRQQHLQLVEQTHARGELLLAGALAKPAERAVLAFRCAERGIPETFLIQDPDVVKGLVRKGAVLPWSNVSGKKEVSPA